MSDNKNQFNHLKAMDLSKEPNYMGDDCIGYYQIAVTQDYMPLHEQVRYRCIENFLRLGKVKVDLLSEPVFCLTDNDDSIVEIKSFNHWGCDKISVLCVNKSHGLMVLNYFDNVMEYFFNDEFWYSDEYSEMEQKMKCEYFADEIKKYSKSPFYYKIYDWLDEHTEPDGHTFYFRESELNDFIDNLVYEVVSDRIGENSFEPDKVLDIIFDGVSPQGLLERGLFGIMNRESDLMQVANNLSYEEKEKIKALAKLI